MISEIVLTKLEKELRRELKCVKTRWCKKYRELDAGGRASLLLELHTARVSVVSVGIVDLVAFVLKEVSIAEECEGRQLTEAEERNLIKSATFKRTGRVIRGVNSL